MAYLQAQRTAAAKDRSRSARASDLSEESADAAITVVQMEHYDIFEDDVIVFWVDVSNVPQTMQTAARQIDAGRFDPNCFGVCVNYDFERRQFYIVADTEESEAHPGNVYYIDSAGGKHWFTAELPQAFLEQAFLACVQAVAHENCERKPTEREAYQSAAEESEVVA